MNIATNQSICPSEILKSAFWMLLFRSNPLRFSSIGTSTGSGAVSGILFSISVRRVNHSLGGRGIVLGSGEIDHPAGLVRRGLYMDGNLEVKVLEISLSG